MWPRLPILILAATGGLLSAEAGATYSIVATDQGVMHVGGAGTSCVGTLDVRIILGVAPGMGAVHAQAQINTAGRDQAVTMLMQGALPADIITAISAPGFDSFASLRQYGVVDLLGNAAGWTGTNNGAYANDGQGIDGVYTYSVQGNILTGQPVLDQAENAFINGGGCDLPDKLMLALEAGALGGHGDTRCTGQGIPSDSAFISVYDQGGAAVIDLSVTNTAPSSPLGSLRVMYDGWRASNPCPSGTGTSATTSATSSGMTTTATGTSGGVTDTGTTTGSASPSGGPTTTTGTTSSTTMGTATGSAATTPGFTGTTTGATDGGPATGDDGDATGGGTGMTGGSDSGAGDGGLTPPDPSGGSKGGGCGCASAPGRGIVGMVLLLPLLARSRRRRR